MRSASAFFLFALLFSAGVGHAQDIHFSQFMSSPQNLNPALTGLFDGDMRLIANHKNQWSSVPVPWNTLSGAFDAKVLSNKTGKDMLGAGILLNSDKAGDSDFGTLLGALSLAYARRVGQGAQFVSAGLQIGMAQRSINYSKLSFDQQYNGERYVEGSSNGEALNSTGFSFLDVGAGINWHYQPVARKRFDAGIGAYHLNSPGQSLLSHSDVKLSPRLSAYTEAEIMIHPLFDLLPAFIVYRQGQFTEMNLGTTVRYLLTGKAGSISGVYLGTWYRFKDAFIVSTGLDYENLRLGMSYDINSSDLTKATSGKGGFEISLIYIFRRTPEIPVKKVPCPTYL